MHGGSLTSLPSASGVDYIAISGIVVSNTGGSLVIETGDGSNTTVSLNQGTQILVTPAPVPATSADFAPGAIVTIEMQDGVAQTVRVLAAPTN